MFSPPQIKSFQKKSIAAAVPISGRVFYYFILSVIFVAASGSPSPAFPLGSLDIRLHFSAVSNRYVLISHKTDRQMDRVIVGLRTDVVLSQVVRPAMRRARSMHEIMNAFFMSSK